MSDHKRSPLPLRWVLSLACCCAAKPMTINTCIYAFVLLMFKDSLVCTT